MAAPNYLGQDPQEQERQALYRASSRVGQPQQQPAPQGGSSLNSLLSGPTPGRQPHRNLGANTPGVYMGGANAPTPQQMTPQIQSQLQKTNGAAGNQQEMDEIGQSGWSYGQPAPEGYRYSALGTLQNKPTGWETFGRVAGIAAPTLATIATGGAASPWLAASLGGGASAASTRLQGGSWGDTLLSGGLGAASGGLGASNVGTLGQVGGQAAIGALGGAATGGGVQGSLLGAGMGAARGLGGSQTPAPALNALNSFQSSAGLATAQQPGFIAPTNGFQGTDESWTRPGQSYGSYQDQLAGQAPGEPSGTSPAQGGYTDPQTLARMMEELQKRMGGNTGVTGDITEQSRQSGQSFIQPPTGASQTANPAWDTDGYGAPAFTAQNFNSRPPAGWDEKKWNDPNHQTPKYVWGRITEDDDPDDIGQMLKAYPGATFDGKDKISGIPGLGPIDVYQGASQGGTKPQWYDINAAASEGGSSAPQGGSPSMGGPSGLTSGLMQQAGGERSYGADNYSSLVLQYLLQGLGLDRAAARLEQ